MDDEEEGEEDVGSRGEAALHVRDLYLERVMEDMAARAGHDPEIIRLEVRSPSASFVMDHAHHSVSC